MTNAVQCVSSKNVLLAYNSAVHEGIKYTSKSTATEGQCGNRTPGKRTWSLAGT